MNSQDFSLVLNKFYYEISFRKQEFLNICFNKDVYKQGFIRHEDFFQVLNKFTFYLSSYEKEKLIYKLMKNGYIYYIEIVNNPYIYYTFNEKIEYENVYLQHKSTKTKIDEYLQPIEVYLNEKKEENFLILLSKTILNKVIFQYSNIISHDLHAKRIDINKNIDFFIFFEDFLLKYDYDKDGLLTIGELSDFIVKSSEEKYNLYEVRYVFELFDIKGRYPGKVLVSELKKFLLNNFQKEVLSIEGDENLIKNKKIHVEEEEYVSKFMKKNKIIIIIKEMLILYGKKSTIDKLKVVKEHLTSKGEHLNETEFFLESFMFEMTFQKSEFEIDFSKFGRTEKDEFFLFCFKKNFIKTEEDMFMRQVTFMSIKINMSKVFEYIYEYFNLKQNEISEDFFINDMKQRIFSQIDNNLIRLFFNFQDQNEFINDNIDTCEFRKSIQNSFEKYNINTINKLVNSNIPSNKSYKSSISKENIKKTIYALYFMNIFNEFDKFDYGIDAFESSVLRNISKKIQLKYDILQKEHDSPSKLMNNQYKKEESLKKIEYDDINHFNNKGKSNFLLNSNNESKKTSLNLVKASISGLFKESNEGKEKSTLEGRRNKLNPSEISPVLYKLSSDYIINNKSLKEIANLKEIHYKVFSPSLFISDKVKEYSESHGFNENSIRKEDFILLCKEITNNQSVIEYLEWLIDKKVNDDNGFSYISLVNDGGVSHEVIIVRVNRVYEEINQLIREYSRLI